MPTKQNNIFTRKLGPLPGWAWVAGGVVVVYVYLAHRKGAGGANAADGTPTGTTLAGVPVVSTEVPSSYEQGASDQAVANLISALAAQIQANTSPGNPAAPPASPGNTGNPGVQPSPVVAIDYSTLPRVNSADYPMIGTAGMGYDPIGSITGPGGAFEGENVAGGAPVYAFINGQYVQDFNTKTLPVGTQLYVPSQFGSYIIPGSVKETL